MTAEPEFAEGIFDKIEELEETVASLQSQISSEVSARAAADSARDARVTALESSGGCGGFLFALTGADGDLIGSALVNRHDGILDFTTLAELDTVDEPMKESRRA